MGTLTRPSWFSNIIQIQGSVIPSVMPRVLVCAVFGGVVSLLAQLGIPVSFQILGGWIPNIVLGLLLVFRTNTAYERFWEGRKLWGDMVNTTRNLARLIWIGVKETDRLDREAKITTLHMLVAFSVATKTHLRQEVPGHDLEVLLPAGRFLALQGMNNPPLEIAMWIGDYFQQQHQRGRLNIYLVTALHRLLDKLIDDLGGCERIIRTPIPLAYAIHLKQLLLIYCLLLPFEVVHNLGWLTGPTVALASFTLFGIEEIGVEIENPFGRDPNDLPLDAICLVMKRNIDDLIGVKPNAYAPFLAEPLPNWDRKEGAQ